MKSVPGWFLVVVLLLVSCSFLQVQAEWPPDGTPVCLETNAQIDPQLTTDGSCGAIVTWHEWRHNPLISVYAQKIDASGRIRWATGGVEIVATSGDTLLPQIVSDGMGGAIIAWQDACEDDFDIYAQRIDAGGSAVWSPGGVAICTADSDQVFTRIATDGNGGAIVAWIDCRGSVDHIYARRIDAAGTVHWAVDGVAVCSFGSGNRAQHKIISDARGGAIVTWVDWRDESELQGDIYAQRIFADGSIRTMPPYNWAADGVAVCDADSIQSSPRIVPDGESGAILTWWDRRSGSRNIYAQRVDSTGAVPTGVDQHWPEDGVAVCSFSRRQVNPELAPDTEGGAIIVWMDDRNDDDRIYDIFAQRVDGHGTLLWSPASGIPISQVSGLRQSNPQIVPDGKGGAIVVWRRGEAGVYDLHAQAVSADGEVPPPNSAWSADGLVVCAADNSQWRPRVVSSGLNCALVTWQDFRTEKTINPTDELDIYVQRLLPDCLTHVDCELGSGGSCQLAGNYPNPFNPTTTIRYQLTVAATVTLNVYDVSGRRVRTLIAGKRQAEGLHEVRWLGRDDQSKASPSGVYFYRLMVDGDTETRSMVLTR